MRLRRGALITALLCLASPALADAVLPIGGAFGNEAGCAFFITGMNAGDDLAILTPDTFTTAEAGCYFETLVSKGDGRFELLASCQGKGSTAAVKGTVGVRGDAAGGYYVVIPDTPERGPLRRCPGTEELFEPLGIQV